MGTDRVAGEQRAAAAPARPAVARAAAGAGKEELRRAEHLSAQNLLALQRSAGNRTVVQLFKVYRGGSTTDKNLTPRVQDTTGPKKGLSTFENSGAIKNYDKAQIIETDNLGAGLEAVRNGTGPQDSHVSIVPSNDVGDAKLVNWAAQKQPEFPALTNAVRGAITGVWRPTKK